MKTKSSIQWLNRRLLELHGHLALCVTEDEYKEVCKEALYFGPDLWLSDANTLATIHRFYDIGEAKETIYCLCIDPARQKDSIGTVNTIMHECIHIWQFHRDDILNGENVSKEVEAYSIANLTETILREYYERTRASRI